MNKGIFKKTSKIIFSEYFSINVKSTLFGKNYFNLAKKISFEAIQNGDKSNRQRLTSTEVCHQTFGS